MKIIKTILYLIFLVPLTIATAATSEDCKDWSPRDKEIIYNTCEDPFPDKREHDENGQLFTGIKEDLRNDPWHGTKTGRITEYKDGKLHGHDIYYLIDGSRQFISYKDGKLDGLSENYNADGDKISSFCYQEDVRVDMPYCSTNGGDQ